MPIAPAVPSSWQFWDGRADSLWAQALGPVENPVEHGFTRVEVADAVRRNHRDAYERVFGPLPPAVARLRSPRPATPLGNAAQKAAWAALERGTRDAVNDVFVNVGKAIAAFERRQRIAPSRFDAYVAELAGGNPRPATLTKDEVSGLRIFIGKGQCTQCHNGPLFTNNGFANTGVPRRAGLPEDLGRSSGIRLALADPFNCRGRFSDAKGDACAELDFAVAGSPEQLRAYKVPSLRGIADRAPFMHAGQFATLEEVLEHYSRAPAAPAGHSELKPRNLTAEERRQLIAFLKSLSAAGPN
jgi:cytochrome c peroxidase